jgi:hypothetical protein
MVPMIMHTDGLLSDANKEFGTLSTFKDLIKKESQGLYLDVVVLLFFRWSSKRALESGSSKNLLRNITMLSLILT